MGAALPVQRRGLLRCAGCTGAGAGARGARITLGNGRSVRSIARHARRRLWSMLVKACSRGWPPVGSSADRQRSKLPFYFLRPFSAKVRLPPGRRSGCQAICPVSWHYRISHRPPPRTFLLDRACPPLSPPCASPRRIAPLTGPERLPPGRQRSGPASFLWALPEDIGRSPYARRLSCSCAPPFMFQTRAIDKHRRVMISYQNRHYRLRRRGAWR